MNGEEGEGVGTPPLNRARRYGCSRSNRTIQGEGAGAPLCGRIEDDDVRHGEDAGFEHTGGEGGVGAVNIKGRSIGERVA